MSGRLGRLTAVLAVGLLALVASVSAAGRLGIDLPNGGLGGRQRAAPAPCRRRHDAHPGEADRGQARPHGPARCRRPPSWRWSRSSSTGSASPAPRPTLGRLPRPASWSRTSRGPPRPRIDLTQLDDARGDNMNERTRSRPSRADRPARSFGRYRASRRRRHRHRHRLRVLVVGIVLLSGPARVGHLTVDQPDRLRPRHPAAPSDERGLAPVRRHRPAHHPRVPGRHSTRATPGCSASAPRVRTAATSR